MAGGPTRMITADASLPDASLPMNGASLPDVQQTLTDASTVAIDCSQGRNMLLTTTAGVGASRKLGNPTKAKVGWYFLDITSHNASGVDITFDTNYVFSQGVAPHLSGVANCKDLLSMYWNGSKMIVSLGSANHG